MHKQIPTSPDWLPAPEDLMLVEDQVHVWRANLSPSHPVEQLAAILSPAERERALQFKFERLRTHYIVAHAVLRLILAEYLKLEPHRIAFSVSPTGKPSLAGDETISFNMSNSGDMALYAFARQQPVGVDIERVRPLNDLDGLARSSLSAPEYDLLQSLPQNKRQATFFRAWTLKEAYLKATGEGLAGLADATTIIDVKDGEAVLGMPKGGDASHTRWIHSELMPADEYHGAVVYRGDPTRSEDIRVLTHDYVGIPAP